MTSEQHSSRTICWIWGVALFALVARPAATAAGPPPAPGLPAAPLAAPAPGSGVAEPPMSPVATPPRPSAAPEQLVVERGQSPWRGYTGSAAEEQAGYHVQALPLQPGWEEPVGLRAYQMDGRPVLAIDRAARRVHVDSRLCTDVSRIDLPRLAAGERRHVTRLIASPTAFPRPRFVRFLLESQLLLTYWHLTARLTLLQEQSTATGYFSSWSGVHQYYTDRRHEEPFRFTVEIDESTGEVTVRGD
ncbi:MAG: hypothetical protein RBU45_05170 [Myxococcota bacterium]|nr:hypothetical protein [Myxococcota bacterium]